MTKLKEREKVRKKNILGCGIWRREEQFSWNSYYDEYHGRSLTDKMEDNQSNK